jgi:hypothetical protein
VARFCGNRVIDVGRVMRVMRIVATYVSWASCLSSRRAWFGRARHGAGPGQSKGDRWSAMAQRFIGRAKHIGPPVGQKNRQIISAISADYALGTDQATRG